MRTFCLAAEPRSSFARTSLGWHSPASSAISCGCKSSASQSPRPWPRVGWRTFCRSACRLSAVPIGFRWAHYPSSCPCGSLRISSRSPSAQPETHGCNTSSAPIRVEDQAGTKPCVMHPSPRWPAYAPSCSNPPLGD